MLRLLMAGALIPGWGQGWCLQPPLMKGLAQWRLYHPLPEGRQEAAARAILQLLLEDSIVRYVRYVYHVQVRYHRLSAWMVLDGEATEEGAYAFFHALRGAVDRFPQLLQRYQGVTLEEGEWPQVAARQVWGDTVHLPTPLQVSQLFYEVWLGGKLQGIYWGKQGGMLRRHLPFVGLDSLRGAGAYPWLEPSLSLQPLPAQASAVFYSRWLVRRPSWAALVALWAYLKGLESYLCEEKQLSCQFFWSPAPIGIEVWIYTAFPYAVLQALESYRGRYLQLDSARVRGRFLVWQRENPLFLGQWSCLWGLGSYQEPSERELRQEGKQIKGMFFGMVW